MAVTLKIAHAARAHSTLGASGAYRWIPCPGSVAAQEGKPDESSIYADEGTAAHQAAERALSEAAEYKRLPAGLKIGIDAPRAADLIGDVITVGNHPFTVDDEMAEAVQTYVDRIMADYEPDKGDVIMIEKRFDLSALHPGMFGTNDACVYKPSVKRLIVYDFKYGKGHAVEAVGNPQLRYYALGAAREVQGLLMIDIVIIQPRAPHREGPIRSETISALELLEWSSDLIDAAVRTTDPNAPRIPGEWCDWCRAAGTCPELAEAASEAAVSDFDGIPADLPNETLTAILDKVDVIKAWIKGVGKEAFTRLQAGDDVPGWKLVAKRARRAWMGDDESIAGALLSTGSIDEGDIWDRKLRSPAQIEKLLPKAKRADLASLYESRSTGITMARESDRRPAVDPAIAAEAEFDPIED